MSGDVIRRERDREVCTEERLEGHSDKEVACNSRTASDHGRNQAKKPPDLDSQLPTA